jgi:bacterioferritin-associated ferredoxin
MDVLRESERFPCLCGAVNPEDLRARVAACDAAVADIFRRTSEAAERAVRQKAEVLKQQLREFQESGKVLEARIRPQLDRLRLVAEVLCEGHFFDRLKGKGLYSQLSKCERQLARLCEETRDRAQRHGMSVRGLLERDTRDRTLHEQISRELETMKGIIASKEFAGAVAEAAVIHELRSLPVGCSVFNDVRLEAGRYIHFGGNPIMSAQIDTLVITPAGVFVVEVKNWSRKFAQSGEGFSPFEQVERASYLVFDQLRSAGFDVRARSIIATNGSLPRKGDHKVIVVPIHRIRQCIEKYQAAGVDVYGVRAALGL